MALMAGTLTMTTSCKDFLNITPVDNLSGNNFWKSPQDVEQYTSGIYSIFREATMQQMFFPATGDLRCAPINRTSATNGYGRNYLSYLRGNNLKAILNQVDVDKSDYFGFKKLTQWGTFYKMIQNANILYYQVDNIDAGILTDTQKKQYKAEAVFLRNLAYFFLVRLYGDVSYYTEPFHSKAIGRTPMLDVLKNATADMEAHYKDLPWTYEDPSIVAVRAMRGAAITLMMHMNMWSAGFSAEKNVFYERTADLGKEVMEESGTAYQLLPLARTKEIFKGRTKEGLFEIVQNFNFGESFHLSSTFADYVLRAPNKVTLKSYIYYDNKFMEGMYPAGVSDNRKTTWFDQYINDTQGMMQILKFVNVFMEEGEDHNPDDNQVVFRYADPILLRAEALAELGRDTEAQTVVNAIRTRASAAPFTSVGDELKDDIWWERVRELIGEGHFYYDLVRTKKVINSKYTMAPMSVDAFNRGGWTWPIDASALANNPYMTLNTYWN